MRLPTDIASCHELIEQLLEQVVSLSQRVSQLEAQLNQNSQNSSKPPSTDKIKPKRKPGIAKKPKPQGGQKGHKGDTLKMVSCEQIDKVEALKPDRCSCGKRLLRQQMEVHARRQVFDIPNPKLEVTEYQQYSCSCPDCGKLNVGQFPAPIKAPVQYGAGVQTLVSLLNVKYQLSYQHIGELFQDLFSQPINGATIQSFMVKAYQQSKSVAAQIKLRLLSSAICHGDETGIRIAGNRNWLHVLSNDAYTYLYVHEKRGKQAIKETLPQLYEYRGVLVHDCWASYWSIHSATHALCIPHILRELTALIEQDRIWAAQMHQLLMILYAKYREGLPIHRRSHEWREYRRICKLALEQEAPPIKNARGRPRKSKGRNLAERLIKYQEEVLRFALEEHVPFSNNQAERDLRPVKGKQKVAGCFRTWEGAKRYAQLASILSTWRKQGYNVFEELKAILTGKHFNFEPQLT